MNTFRHFILTRYAMRHEQLGVPNDEWLEHRLDLFHRFTLPSVAEQSTRDFIWVVFIDRALRHNDRVLRATAALRAVDGLRSHIVFDDTPWGACTDGVIAGVEAAANDFLPSTHLITTRLDNDDAIAPDFIELVQREFAGQATRTFVNFDNGQNLRLSSGEFVPHPHRSNMFLSLIEPREGFRTVLAWAHNSAPEVGDVIHLDQPARWTHVVHERNVWPER